MPASWEFSTYMGVFPSNGMFEKCGPVMAAGLSQGKACVNLHVNFGTSLKFERADDINGCLFYTRRNMKKNRCESWPNPDVGIVCREVVPLEVSSIKAIVEQPDEDGDECWQLTCSVRRSLRKVVMQCKPIATLGQVLSEIKDCLMQQNEGKFTQQCKIVYMPSTKHHNTLMKNVIKPTTVYMTTDTPSGIRKFMVKKQ